LTQTFVGPQHVNPQTAPSQHVSPAQRVVVGSRSTRSTCIRRRRCTSWRRRSRSGRCSVRRWCRSICCPMGTRCRCSTPRCCSGKSCRSRWCPTGRRLRYSMFRRECTCRHSTRGRSRTPSCRRSRFPPGRMSRYSRRCLRRNTHSRSRSSHRRSRSTHSRRSRHRFCRPRCRRSTPRPAPAGDKSHRGSSIPGRSRSWSCRGWRWLWPAPRREDWRPPHRTASRRSDEGHGVETWGWPRCGSARRIACRHPLPPPNSASVPGQTVPALPRRLSVTCQACTPQGRRGN